MKILLLFLFMLPARAEVADADKKEIELLVNSYVSAFDRGDFEAIKNVVTTEFLESIGGEENLRKQHQALRKARKAEKLRFREQGGGVYVQFDVSADGKVEETMSATEWFRLVRSKSGWKLQRREADFEPEIPENP